MTAGSTIKIQSAPTDGGEDTIAAISTPLGAGGIGIVRLSGSQALSITQRLFIPSRHNGQPPPSHTLRHGHIIDPATKSKVDEVLLAQMRAPHTFTREDMAEINCHGGLIPLQQTLRLCLALGARLAEPGEFTKRAYLNGRIDLAQAEAVIDIIQARTQTALRTAMSQLEGGLSQKIKELRQELLNTLAQVEASIDFPEEELEIAPPGQIAASLDLINQDLSRLMETFSRGRWLREGVTTAIVGRPNVGKSTLLNQLLQQERAIVSPIPGTTRDTIEESVNVGGFPLCLIDTAGITHTDDIIERQGIERTLKALNQAELVLLILDGSQPLAKDDLTIIEAAKTDGKNIILIINKIDLKQRIDLKQVQRELPAVQVIHMSAVQGQGLDKLTSAITRHLSGEQAAGPEGAMVTNARHYQALFQTRQSLEQALAALRQGLSPEFVALDLNLALNQLGEIIGQTTSADVLEHIFSRFCIGK
jgi:tRNA modification GTPase